MASSGNSLGSLSTSSQMNSHVEEPRNFAPKDPPKLDPPKDDPISAAELAKHDGVLYQLPRVLIYITRPSANINIQKYVGTNTLALWVAIKGLIFDVSGNKSYAPGGPYHRTIASPLHATTFANLLMSLCHLTSY